MSDKLPIIRVSFKAGFGAYFGVMVARAIDRQIGETLTNAFGTPEEMAAKIVNRILGRKG